MAKRKKKPAGGSQSLSSSLRAADLKAGIPTGRGENRQVRTSIPNDDETRANTRVESRVAEGNRDGEVLVDRLEQEQLLQDDAGKIRSGA